MQINLELRIILVLLVAFISRVGLRVLQSTHGIVPGYSNGQTMRRSTMKMELKTSTRIRLVSYRQELPVAFDEGFDYVSSAVVFCCKT